VEEKQLQQGGPPFWNGVITHSDTKATVSGDQGSDRNYVRDSLLCHCRAPVRYCYAECWGVTALRGGDPGRNSGELADLNSAVFGT